MAKFLIELAQLVLQTKMEFNFDFTFLESMPPLMLYMFIISSTRMSIRTALHFP